MSNTKIPEALEARLQINIFVDCPNKDCGWLIDLLDESDTNGCYQNEEGSLLEQACPSEGHWSIEHKKFECNNVVCTQCKTEFNVKGLGW